MRRARHGHRHRECRPTMRAKEKRVKKRIDHMKIALQLSDHIGQLSENTSNHAIVRPWRRLPTFTHSAEVLLVLYDL